MHTLSFHIVLFGSSYWCICKNSLDFAEVILQVVEYAFDKANIVCGTWKKGCMLVDCRDYFTSSFSIITQFRSDQIPLPSIKEVIQEQGVRTCKMAGLQQQRECGGCWTNWSFA
jgi:hypothetical protein